MIWSFHECVVSYSSFTFTMFTSFRAACLRALNFDGFFPDSLDDVKDVFAFMLPKSYFESKNYEPLIPFLKSIFASVGWSCKSTEVLEQGTYYTDHCGSRFRTHHLGPHILFRVEVEDVPQSSQPLPEKPAVPNWSVAEVSYDSLKPPNSYIGYYTSRYEAAFPDEYMSTLNRLKAEALTEMRKYS